jgi:hypothetical protein
MSSASLVMPLSTRSLNHSAESSHGRACPSRRRCVLGASAPRLRHGWGEPGSGAGVCAGVSPVAVRRGRVNTVPFKMWAGVGTAAVQMCAGAGRFSPGAAAAGVSPFSPGADAATSPGGTRARRSRGPSWPLSPSSRPPKLSRTRSRPRGAQLAARCHGQQHDGSRAALAAGLGANCQRLSTNGPRAKLPDGAVALPTANYPDGVAAPAIRAACDVSYCARQAPAASAT